jgi:hypothetical protein
MSPWFITFKGATNTAGTEGVATKRVRVLVADQDHEAATDSRQALDGYEEAPLLFRKTIEIECWDFLVNPHKSYLTDRANPLRPQDGQDLEELFALFRKPYTWITEVTLPRYDAAKSGYYAGILPLLVAYRSHSRSRRNGRIEITFTLAKRVLET